MEEHPLGESFWGPFTVSATEELVVLSDQNCTGLWAISMDSSESTALVDSSEHEECDAQFAPDGRPLAYTSKDLPPVAPSALVISNADGREPRMLLQPSAAEFQIHDLAWSRDGSRIAFAYGLFRITSPAVSTLYIIDVPPDLARMEPEG
jgi:dipeptidyl aminopeptidase/acylaminoacyl peptidase